MCKTRKRNQITGSRSSNYTNLYHVCRLINKHYDQLQSAHRDEHRFGETFYERERECILNQHVPLEELTTTIKYVRGVSRTVAALIKESPNLP